MIRLPSTLHVMAMMSAFPGVVWLGWSLGSRHERGVIAAPDVASHTDLCAVPVPVAGDGLRSVPVSAPNPLVSFLISLPQGDAQAGDLQRVRAFANGFTSADALDALNSLNGNDSFAVIELRLALVRVACRTRPKEAALLLLKVPDYAWGRQEVLAEAFGRWAEKSPQELVAALADITHEGDRREAGLALTGRLPPASLHKYAAILDMAFPTEEDRERIMHRVAGRFVDGTLPIAELRQLFASLPAAWQESPGLLRGWMKQATVDDMTELEAFALQLPAGPGKAAAFAALAERAAISDFGPLLDFAEQQPYYPESAYIIKQVGRVWAALAPQESEIWLSSLPDGPLRTEALIGVAEGWATQHPVEAAAWASSLTDERLQRLAVFSVAHTWSSRMPAEAAAWVASFPPSQLQEDSLTAVIQHWARQDALTANQFVESLPPGIRHVSRTALRMPQAPQ